MKKLIMLTGVLISCLTANIAFASSQRSELSKAQREITSLQDTLNHNPHDYEKLYEVQLRVDNLESRLCEDGFDTTNNKAEVYVFDQVAQLQIDVRAQLREIQPR